MAVETRQGWVRKGMMAAATAVALVPAATSFGDRPVGREGGERVVVEDVWGAPLPAAWVGSVGFEQAVRMYAMDPGDAGAWPRLKPQRHATPDSATSPAQAVTRGAGR